MNAEDFAAWLAHMGWSQRRAARELGCAQNSIKAWLKNGAPTYIGFACTSLAMGWPAWEQAAQQ
jgi:hypothetical protein